MAYPCAKIVLNLLIYGYLFMFLRCSSNISLYGTELAKRYNIKGANSIIDKAISIVRNYEHYAQQAGVSPHWIQKITEEIGYRIEKVKRKF